MVCFAVRPGVGRLGLTEVPRWMNGLRSVRRASSCSYISATSVTKTSPHSRSTATLDNFRDTNDANLESFTRIIKNMFSDESFDKTISGRLHVISSSLMIYEWIRLGCSLDRMIPHRRSSRLILNLLFETVDCPEQGAFQSKLGCSWSWTWSVFSM